MQGYSIGYPYDGDKKASIIPCVLKSHFIIELGEMSWSLSPPLIYMDLNVHQIPILHLPIMAQSVCVKAKPHNRTHERGSKCRVST